MGKQRNGAEGIDRHVLVVDDDEALARVVADALEHVDGKLQTSYTTDPQRALATLGRGGIDCLVTDYEMPGRDGLELAAADSSDTPFVLFTQRRDGALERHTRERGGTYFPKRIGIDQYRELAAVVHEQAAEC